jgi:hypothetical protein
MYLPRMKTLIYLFTVFCLFSACNKDKVFEDSKIKFVKRPDPVWEGKWTAADPSVVRDGDTLRMYYSSLVIDGEAEQLLIAGAKSVDGIHWTPSNGVLGEESVALATQAGAWDNHLEAVSVLGDSNGLWMYYCGYPEEAEVAGTIVAKSRIGVAQSSDGITFTRSGAGPYIGLGAANAPDQNALFSPTVVRDNGQYAMLYVGYCIEDCEPAYIGLLGATSPDGTTWTKRSTPVVSGTDLGLKWAEVVKEPCLVKGPDSLFYLFFSGDHYLGVARSTDVFGPYEAYPYPILINDQDWEEESVIAPSVLIEDGKARMWYMGVTAKRNSADFAIGYAELDFPFDW